jgi:chromosome segregation ATPase
MRTKTEIEKAKRTVEATIAKLKKEIEDLEKRKAAAESRLAAVPNESGLRARRQEMLARGENVDSLSREINKNRDLAELLQDEIAGLSRMIGQRQGPLQAAQKELSGFWLETVLIDCEIDINDWNATALKLAKILARMHVRQAEYASAGGTGCFYQVQTHGGDSAMTRIPKLFGRDEIIPKEHTELLFWDAHSARLFIDLLNEKK